MSFTVEQNRKLWNDRAEKHPTGYEAGSNDPNLFELEVTALDAHVPYAGRVLDVGCGNGEVIARLRATRPDVTFVGVDFASKMIEAAKARLPDVEFHVCDVRKLAKLKLGRFACIYTIRCLINLPTHAEQQAGVKAILDCLKPRGCYVCVEPFIDGLDVINSLRCVLDLQPIREPWHNRYLRDKDAQQTFWGLGNVVTTEHFASTYYFMSRVVNAAVAASEGREPKYDDPLNIRAMRLSPVGEYAPHRLVIVTPLAKQ